MHRSDETILWKAMAADAELDEVLQEAGRVGGFDAKQVAYLRGYRNALAWVLGWERERDGDVHDFLMMCELEVQARYEDRGS
jgi:hypothetical protein